MNRRLGPAAPCKTPDCGDITVSEVLWLQIPTDVRALLIEQGIVCRRTHGRGSGCTLGRKAARCANCDCALFRGRTWRTIDPALRRKLTSIGVRAHRGRNLCSTCYTNMAISGDIVDFETSVKPRAYVLEEFERVVGQHPGLSLEHQIRNAAPRLGMTEEALSRALYRARLDHHTPTTLQEAS